MYSLPVIWRKSTDLFRVKMKGLLLWSLFTATELHCFWKKRGSENQFCLVDIPPRVSPETISNQLQPWSHVLSPEERHSSQTVRLPILCWMAQAHRASAQLSREPPRRKRELSGAYVALSGCLTVFLSDTPTILCSPLPLLFDISIWTKEGIYFSIQHSHFSS